MKQLTISHAIKDGLWLTIDYLSYTLGVCGGFLTFLWILIASYKTMGGTILKNGLNPDVYLLIGMGSLLMGIVYYFAEQMKPKGFEERTKQVKSYLNNSKFFKPLFKKRIVKK